MEVGWQAGREEDKQEACPGERGEVSLPPPLGPNWAPLLHHRAWSLPVCSVPREAPPSGQLQSHLLRGRWQHQLQGLFTNWALRVRETSHLFQALCSARWKEGPVKTTVCRPRTKTRG